MGCYLTGVTGEGVVAFFVGLGFQRIEVGIHGSLGIDDDLFSSRKADDEIGTEALAFVGRGGRLGGEVTVLLHSSHFDHTLQLDFAPLPSTGGLTKSFDQRTGFLVQPLLGFRKE